MGFELGPKLLRRAPRGWLPARAFPLRHSVFSNDQGSDGGETVFDTSSALDVRWRVELPGPRALRGRGAPLGAHVAALQLPR